MFFSIFFYGSDGKGIDANVPLSYILPVFILYGYILTPFDFFWEVYNIGGGTENWSLNMNKNPVQLVLELVNAVIRGCSNSPHVDDLRSLPTEVSQLAIELVVLLPPVETAEIPHLEVKRQSGRLGGMVEFPPENSGRRKGGGHLTPDIAQCNPNR